MSVEAISGISAHAIQLAIAPVFLLTGFAGLLNVMAGRLARVIDRARALEANWPALDVDEKAAARAEIRTLERRRRACSWAIASCTTATLLVCLVIVTLFAEEFLGFGLRWLVATLFIAAMIAVIFGLSCFLREVSLATRATSIELARFS